MSAILFLVFATVVTGVVCLAVFLRPEFPSKDPVFTVSITGVAGLDVLLTPPPPPPPPSAPSPAPGADVAAADGYDDYDSLATATPSPVFDLAFQIDNTRNGNYEACVPGLSTAEVSYGDAFLAGGSVPPSCAGTKRTSSSTARAWGENVDVPLFLRAQLAAELAAGDDASVDVKVTMPEYCQNGCCGGTAVLSCKAMIGGGASPACRLDYL